MEGLVTLFTAVPTGVAFALGNVLIDGRGATDALFSLDGGTGAAIGSAVGLFVAHRAGIVETVPGTGMIPIRSYREGDKPKLLIASYVGAAAVTYYFSGSLSVSGMAGVVAAPFVSELLF